MIGKPTTRRWTIFALASASSFVLYLHRYTWNFIAPELREEYGFSETQVGTLGSLFNWTYGALQIPSGMVADFFGPHLFLGVSIAVWSLAMVLQGIPGVSGNFTALGGVRLLFGVGQAGAYPALTRVTHTWFPQDTRTTVQGWVATFFGRGGGFMSSILMATVLMGYFGLSWQVSLVLMSVIGLALAFLFLMLFRNDPSEDPRVNEAELEIIRAGRIDTGKETGHVLPWKSALRSRSMQFFVLQQFFNAGADNVYSLQMGAFFLSVKGVDITQAGLFVGLPLLGGAVGGMVGGICNDVLIRWTGSRRWGRTLMGFTGKILACGLMFVAISRESAAAAGWSLFVVKFFSDWSQPTVWGACTDLGGKYSASIFSIINTSGTLGGVICPPLFGWILDTFEYFEPGVGAVVPGYRVLFPVVAGMYVVSGVSWFFIDCSKPLGATTEPAAQETG